jgi:hypothetical protein
MVRRSFLASGTSDASITDAANQENTDKINETNSELAYVST